MLYTSAEIRWFFAGEAGADLLAWFGQSFTAVGMSSRTDRYLTGVGDALSIKLREGRVEVKQRQWVRPGFIVRRTITGRMEGWQKWSFGLGGGEDYDSLAESHPGRWLAVHKRRRLRTFIPETDEITETAPGSYPSSGCHAELTSLEVAGRSWFTIGFESFGVSRDLPGLLPRLAENMLNGDFPLLLDEKDSMGYAAWIEQIFRLG